MIKLEKVCFSYKKGKDIFRNLSCTFSPGVCSAIIGPNGCGKSTLLKIISNSISNYKGKVTVEDKDIRSLSLTELSNLISYLPQKIGYDPDITVIEAIISMFSREIIFEPKRNHKERIEEVINRLGLTSIKDRRLSEISGGELQKVFIAMCMVKDAKVYLFDEPMNNLDIKNQIEIVKIIKELSKTKTVVVVFHEINLAINFSDEIVFMKDGKIVSHKKSWEVDEDIIKNVFDVDVEILAYKSKRFVCYY